MSRNAAIAEALSELAAEQDEQHRLLMEIKGLLVKAIDGHNEHREHVRDGMDRLGTRVLRTENRIGALELVTGK